MKTTWRNFLKDKQSTILNLLGLSTGLASAILIWLWISDELKMGRSNTNDRQLYEVMTNVNREKGIETAEYTSGLLAGALAKEMPEVVAATTVLPASWFSSHGIISFNGTRLKAGGQFVSKDYFKLFTCNFLDGDRNRIFTDKHFVAISDELALKLFHTTKDVVGKQFEWYQDEFTSTYTIVGLFERNSSHVLDKFDLIFNFDLFVDKRPGMLQWQNQDPKTFVLLQSGTDISALNAKISGFIKSKNNDKNTSIFVQQYGEKYLHGQYANGRPSGGRIAYVRLFALIGMFILAIACINFMNLSTAKASRRLKEVGVRKVLGAYRRSLIFQYLSESVLLSFFSLFVALGFIQLFLPAFNSITGKSLVLEFKGSLLLAALLITLVTGLLSGSYPAFYISGFQPVTVLKGKLSVKGGELWLRKGLVTFQFTLSIVAIVAVLIVYKQIKYIHTKDVGYDRSHLIDFAIPLEGDSAKMSSAVTFLKELRNIPGVANVSSYYHNLNGDHGGIGGFQWPGKDPAKEINFANLEVGSGFLETVGIVIKEGRNFSPDERARHEIVFNETAIREMGLKDPLNKTIKFWDQERVIVGVAADFNFESFYQKVKPCFFQIYPVMPNVIVKINAGSEANAIPKIEDKYLAFNKGMVFDYRFLDDEYSAVYAAEKRVADLSKYFAGLAILITCLGLFGLATFTAQRRQKEIGIRKVIGASVARIAFLLSKEFLKLVIIAILIGFPLIWWIMNNWLDEFAYRVHINGDVFWIAGSIVMGITIFTVGFQSIKAAMARPVKSLRTE